MALAVLPEPLLFKNLAATSFTRQATPVTPVALFPRAPIVPAT